MVDLMQIVRTLRAFDGSTRWDFDPDDSGAPGLAGDFDGDGEVDVGGAASISVLGGSLGGINGSVAAGVEPGLDAVVAIVPGGVLGEVGTRLDARRHPRVDDVARVVADLLRQGRRAHGARARRPVRDRGVGSPRAARDGAGRHRRHREPEDRRISLRRGAAVGHLPRGGVGRPGDPLEWRLYHGPLAPLAPEGCVVPDETEAVAAIDTLDRAVAYGGKTFAPGDALVAFADGFGQRRASPDLRRLLGLSQIALESADPANWAPYWAAGARPRRVARAR